MTDSVQNDEGGVPVTAREETILAQAEKLRAIAAELSSKQAQQKEAQDLSDSLFREVQALRTSYLEAHQNLAVVVIAPEPGRHDPAEVNRDD